MTFQEKSVWAQLTSTVVIYSAYFAMASWPFGAGEEDGTPSVVLFLAAVAAQIVALVISHAMFAIRSAPESEDERDSAIQVRALRISSAVLSSGVMLCVLGLFVGEMVGQPGGTWWPLAPYGLANLLLLFFVLSEVSNYGVQVYCYRRGV